MASKNFRKFFSFIFAVILTLGLSVSFQSLLAAYTAPLHNPSTCLTGEPGCDPPISSGSTLVQQIQGGLWVVNAAYPTSPYGLIVEKGAVGIGVIAPSEKLEVAGNIKSSGAFMGQGGTNLTHLPWYNIGASFTGYLKLITPIVHNESNMFVIKITGYEYGQSGKVSDIKCGGYAYSGSTLINTYCYTDGTNLPVEIGTENRSGTTYVVIRLGTPVWSAWYYSHFTAEYIGWQAKNPSGFAWVKGETTPVQTGNTNNVLIEDQSGRIAAGGYAIDSGHHITTPSFYANAADIFGLMVNGKAVCLADGTNCQTPSTNAANISSGTFGANTGGGNYSFPSNITVTGTITASGGSSANWNSAYAHALDVTGAVHGATSAVSGNMIVRRDANGYIFGNYFNSTDDVSAGNLTYLMGKFGDNYHRSATAAKVQAFLGLGSNAYTSTAYLPLTGGAITGNLSVSGTLTAGTLTGGYSGTINAANISSGVFGANTGGGNYSFPGSSRVAINGNSFSSGSSFGFGNGAAWSNLNSLAVDTLETDGGSGGSGTLELNYYGGNEVHIGSGGSKPLRASIFYDGSSGYYVDPNGTSVTNVINANSITPNIISLTTGNSPNSGYNHYAIYEEPGPWNGSAIRGYAYPDLLIEYHTGISYVAYSGYGGHRFYVGYTPDATPTTQVFSIGEGDNNVRVAYNLIVGGQLNVAGADVAEEFGSAEELDFGTVVVMADEGVKTVKPGEVEYDKKVIGVVSDNPSVIMGKISDKIKAVVALAGVVKVKVTAENGEIKRGDLLVTSGLKGHAMRATEEKVGTIIGKALEDFSGQTGLITALINLQ